MDNPAVAPPARDLADAIKRHPRVGAKFVCLIPGHPRRGAVGTIHHVYDDDPPPLPPRLAVGVSWDNADNFSAMAQITNDAATTPTLEELILEDAQALAQAIEVFKDLIPDSRGMFTAVPTTTRVIMSAGNYLTTPRCDGYKVGDSLAVETSGRSEWREFITTTVVAQVRHSRYRLKTDGPRSHQLEFELDVNAGNSYQPLLTQEVGQKYSRGNMSVLPAACPSSPKHGRI